MVFDSSLRKDLARNFVATVIVLVTIVMTILLIRTLGQASRGAINPSEVLLIMGFSLMSQLTTVLALSLFISVIATLSRMYSDSEMVIWQIGGRGLGSLLKPIVRFAWPMLLAIAVLILLIWPWTNQKVSDLKDRFERRGDLERVMPGQFQESANGLRVFFINKDSVENKEGKNVFISSADHGKQAMTSSKVGHIELIDDERFLILNIGQRVEQTVGEDDIKISEFKVYGTRIGQDVKAAAEPPPKATNTVLRSQWFCNNASNTRCKVGQSLYSSPSGKVTVCTTFAPAVCRVAFSFSA